MMIISASRRTDIPALYPKWLVNRLRDGFVIIPNPYDSKKLSKVSLESSVVDCIVFWTKNPAPMMPFLPLIKEMGHDFYFQFTLTAYGPEIEDRLPTKTYLTETFCHLSNLVGPERVVWRYDPIFLDNQHSIQWHLEQYAKICSHLQGFTSRCVISFIDVYDAIRTRFEPVSVSDQIILLKGIADIARKHSIKVYTCAESVDAVSCGAEHAACIDRKLIESLIGYPLSVKKDQNQRTACNCVASIDIGAYNTCTHLCSYCYATKNTEMAIHNWETHITVAPMLNGYPDKDATVTEREVSSDKQLQLRLMP